MQDRPALSGRATGQWTMFSTIKDYSTKLDSRNAKQYEQSTKIHQIEAKREKRITRKNYKLLLALEAINMIYIISRLNFPFA